MHVHNSRTARTHAHTGTDGDEDEGHKHTTVGQAIRVMGMHAKDKRCVSVCVCVCWLYCSCYCNATEGAPARAPQQTYGRRGHAGTGVVVVALLTKDRKSLMTMNGGNFLAVSLSLVLISTVRAGFRQPR